MVELYDIIYSYGGVDIRFHNGVKSPAINYRARDVLRSSVLYTHLLLYHKNRIDYRSIG